VRTVVVQVERGEVVLLVGFRPGSGEATDGVLARVASQPKSRQLTTMRDTLAAFAVGPLAVSVDGKPLAPTSVRAKLGVEPGGGRPVVVVLVTYTLPAVGSQLSVSSKEPRSTRISWANHGNCRIDLERAPAQGRWFDGVASFLLTLAPQCAAPPSVSPDFSPPR
jgi:hypothetical protein